MPVVVVPLMVKGQPIGKATTASLKSVSIFGMTFEVDSLDGWMWLLDFSIILGVHAQALLNPVKHRSLGLDRWHVEALFVDD